MRRNVVAVAVAVAASGAMAYVISKVELALRGELGMPGFPASAESYAMYEPVAGQLSNAAAGVLLTGVILALLGLPAGRVARAVVVGVNVVGAAVVGIGVAGFVARATGLAPVLGEPAHGWAAWCALSVGVVWVVAWTAAIHQALAGRPYFQ